MKRMKSSFDRKKASNHTEKINLDVFQLSIPVVTSKVQIAPRTLVPHTLWSLSNRNITESGSQFGGGEQTWSFLNQFWNKEEDTLSSGHRNEQC
jgi:hypothetical protein